MKKLRVCVFSYIRLFSESLSLYLESCPEVDAVLSCFNASHLVDIVLEFNPDVVLIDTTIESALDEARAISEVMPGKTILAVSLPENAEKVIACADAGLTGYIPRQGSMEDLVNNMFAALDGECSCPPAITGSLMREVQRRKKSYSVDSLSDHLTKRESTILRSLGRGLSNKQIASELTISVATVKNHVHNIFSKLHIHSRSEALALLRKEPWLSKSA